MSDETPGRLVQISVSDGGVPKQAVPQAHISFQGVEGDRQRNRSLHGGPDRAVCLYAQERIDALRREGHSIAPGSAGENFTIAGVPWDQVVPGCRLRIGDAVEVEIMSYTTPCRFNAQWFHEGDFHRIGQKRHPGWSRVYAKVLREGLVRSGDAVGLVLVGGNAQSKTESKESVQ